MNLSNLSFSFKYHGDEISVFYLQILAYLCGSYNRHLFFSKAYGEYFNHFSEYWKLVGSKSALLEVLQRKKSLILDGVAEHELVSVYSRCAYPGKAVAVFSDISREKIGRMLDTLPGSNAKVFLENFVFTPCHTRLEAIKIADSTPINFATVNVFQDGIAVYSNLLHEEDL